MRLMSRILVIMLAALAIVGATFALGQSSAAAAQSARPALQSGASTTAGGELRGHEERQSGPSLAGLGEVLKNLVLLSVVVTIGTLAARPLRGGAGRRAAAQPRAPNQPA